MLNKPITDVTSFHHAYGLGIEHKPTVDIPDHVSKLRFNLMKEENEEYLNAAREGDLVEVGDALGDMLYICLLYTSPSPRDGLLSRMPSSA